MNNEHLNHIKERYDSFERFYQKKSILVAKETPHGYWGVTPLDSLFELFNKLDINKKHSFVDLGSGDGRIVMTAALFASQAHGIEGDKWLNKAANGIRLELMHLTTDQKKSVHEQIISKNPFSKAIIIEDDFMDHDLSIYDYIYISPDKPFYRGTEKKLLKELKGKLIVQSYEFLPKELKLKEEHMIKGTPFKIYENV